MAVTAPASTDHLNAKVRADLASAATQIRLRDAVVGLLGLAVWGLAYISAAVLLDRALDLPASVRWVGLSLFLLGTAVIVGWGVVRPLRRQVNPRFAARQVERAADGRAKNAVINWVDLENESMGEVVRASLATRAAQEVATTDLRKVSETRLLPVLVVMAGLLAALLAGLFLWLKPAPFLSLLTRALNPSTVATIATRSVIRLEEPVQGDANLLAGESLTVRVTIEGRIPDVAAKDRPRLLVWYSANATVPDEIALTGAGSAREFAALLPPSVVQNGFRYVIAAGDVQTAEYRVTVRPRPAILDYEAAYTYPAYSRLRADSAGGARLEALRGTQLELTISANRAVTGGTLRLSTQAASVPGEPVADAPEKLRFRFVLQDSGRYQVAYTTAEGDPGDAGPHEIVANVDARPTVTITQPEPEEITLPANGLLAVDGIAADDFGITSATLKLQKNGIRPTPLASIPYRDGQTLKRESDASYPARVEVKLSQELAMLPVQPGDVIEYWLEAADNREPAANLGRSKPKRVRIGEPAATPEQQKQDAQNAEQRRADEAQHQEQQNRKFAQENRDPPPPKNANPEDGERQQNREPGQPGEPSETPQAPPPDGAPPQNQNGTTGSKQQPDPVQPPERQPDESSKPDPTNQSGTGDSTTPKPDQRQDPQPKKGDREPSGTDASRPESRPEAAPETGSPDPEQQKIQEEADRIQNELNQSKSPQPSKGDKQPGQSNADQPSAKELAEAARDLNNPDPAKREAAEKKLDQAIGQENRKAAQEKARQLEQDLKSDDSKTRENAQKEIDKAVKELQKQAERDNAGQAPKDGPSQPQPGDTQPGSPDSRPDPKAVEQATRDLASDDPKTRQQAEQTLDDAVGKPARETAQKQAEELKKQGESGDAAAQKQAEQKMDELAKQTRDQAATRPQPEGGKGQPQPKDQPGEKTKPEGGTQPGSRPEEAPPPAESQPRTGEPPPGAESTGKAGQPNATDTPKPTDQPSRGDAAQPVDRKAIEQAARDLNSPDPAKQAVARETLDKAMGQKNREAAEQEARQMQEDLKSSDAAKREAAQQKLGNLKKELEKQAAESGEAGKPDPNQPSAQEVEQASRDLGSDDPKKRQAAEETLDQAMGKQNRKAAQEEAQQLAEDLQSTDPAKRQAAEQKLNELKKQAEKASKNANQPGEDGPQPEPTPEQKAEWEQTARDLTNPDPAKREAAEKKFDDAVGREAREGLQKDLNDLQNGTPEQKQEAAERLRERAEQAAKQTPKKRAPGGAPPDTPGDRLVENAKNRLKTAELQLADLEKIKSDPELQKRVGYTPEEYERFLDSVRKSVTAQRADVEKLEAEVVKPDGPAARNIGGGSGGKKATGPGSGTAAGTGTPGQAAPGFAEAQKRFAEAAARAKKAGQQ